MWDKKALLEEFERRGANVQVVEHGVMLTMEDMEREHMPFADEVVKNLFVCDDKKRRFYIVTLPKDKRLNLKALAPHIGEKRLRFAPESVLEERLGLVTGAVTPLGALNDETHEVRVVFDEELRAYAGLGIHPNDNTATVHVPFDELVKLLDEHRVSWQFVKLEEG